MFSIHLKMIGQDQKKKQTIEIHLQTTQILEWSAMDFKIAVIKMFSKNTW